MKIPKKIWTGLASFSLLLVLVFGWSGRALAAVGQSDITAADNQYTFSDGANITADIGGAGQVTFTDVQLVKDVEQNNDRNFTPPDTAGFCKDISDYAYNPDKISTSIKYGITLTSKNLAVTSQNHTAQIPAQLKLGFSQGNNCRGVLLNINIESDSQVAATVFQWNGNDIVNLNNTSPSLTFSEAKNDKDGIYLNAGSGTCDIGAVLAVDGNSARYYRLGDVANGDKSNISSGSYSKDKFAGYLSQDEKDSCFVSGPTHIVSLFGQKGQAAIGYTSSSTSGDESDDTSACVASSHTGLEWLLCPLTNSLSKAAIGLEKLISSQLNFDINRNLNNSGGVHTAWAIIRDIASTLVIILLLVMVFSQAIGGAFLDAYTVKKMLPRLVIAVILMQISWDLCRYLISIANDAGEGLKQIMVAPFAHNGGAIDLDSILHKLNPAWASLSQFGLFIAAIAGIVIAFAALPGTLVMLFGLFVGIFAAFMVLLFRNVLIVALTIFSPLAFLAWTIANSQSGMQNLWKTWRENFTKLLMLFPLLIGIIYTGRIFAWIIASTNQGKPGFIDVLTIFVAYFGPYFIVFRAYKWGGGLLSAAGSGIAQARKGIVNANSGWLKTMGERAQGNLADRYLVANEKEREIEEQIRERQEKGLDTTALEAQLKSSKRAFNRGRRLPVPVPNRAFWKNYKYRIGAGTPIPSMRQKVETLAKGGAYKKDLVEKKQALLHTDMVEKLNQTGSVGATKEYIMQKYGLDNYEKDADGKIVMKNGKPKALDKYTERSFFNWTVDTASWMELGDEDWRMGAVKGKIDASEFMAAGRFAKLNKAIGTHLEASEAGELADKDWVLKYKSDPTLSTEDIILNGARPDFDIAKTPGFVGMMNADPQRYRAVAEKLPLLQPFHQGLGGGPKPVEFVPQVKNGATVIRAGGGRANPALAVDINDYLDHSAAGGPIGKYYDAHLNPGNDVATATRLARQKADRLAVMAAEDARYSRWLRNLEHPTDIGQVRAEHYNLMRDMQQALKESGVQSQSASALKDILDELAQSNSVEGRSIMQRLMGGEKSAREAIDQMFGHGYLESNLGVRVRVPTSLELLRSEVLDPEVKRRYAREVLKVTQTDGRGNPVLSADAVDLVKSVAADYDTRVILNKSPDTNQQWKLIAELRDAASKNRDLSIVFNTLIDRMTQEIQSRVEGVVRQAAAEGKSGDELTRIRDIAVRLANAQVARYQSAKITPVAFDTPVPDGTLIVHPTYEPPWPGPVPPPTPPAPPGRPEWSNGPVGSGAPPGGGPLPPAR